MLEYMIIFLNYVTNCFDPKDECEKLANTK